MTISFAGAAASNGTQHRVRAGRAARPSAVMVPRADGHARDDRSGVRHRDDSGGARHRRGFAGGPLWLPAARRENAVEVSAGEQPLGMMQALGSARLLRVHQFSARALQRPCRYDRALFLGFVAGLNDMGAISLCPPPTVSLPGARHLHRGGGGARRHVLEHARETPPRRRHGRPFRTTWRIARRDPRRHPQRMCSMLVKGGKPPQRCAKPEDVMQARFA